MTHGPWDDGSMTDPYRPQPPGKRYSVLGGLFLLAIIALPVIAYLKG